MRFGHVRMIGVQEIYEVRLPAMLPKLVRNYQHPQRLYPQNWYAAKSWIQGFTKRMRGLRDTINTTSPYSSLPQCLLACAAPTALEATLKLLQPAPMKLGIGTSSSGAGFQRWRQERAFHANQL